MNDDYQYRISNWLGLRQKLLVKIVEIDKITTENLNTTSSQEKINSFCQYLIDYISSGHFEIYHRLMETLENQSPLALDKINRILNSIQDSTDIAVEFNDQYDMHNAKEIDALFRQRLSDLTESLAERFEMEDLLFDHCTNHYGQSLTA